MKMVKSLLLGSAAAFVAVAGAQAADLPVKAKAAEYVKVCSAYGAGYYYIPGTDTCLKVGGYVRFDTYINAIGTFDPMITSTAAAGFKAPGGGAYGYPFTSPSDSNYLTRARALWNFDARTETEYGTLRSYIAAGLQWDSQSGAGAGPGSGIDFERAFIQLAGFTAGYTVSNFNSGKNYMLTTPLSGGEAWTSMLAYTAEFGGGFSATLALEDAANRTTGVQMYGSTKGVWYNIGTSPTALSYANYQAGQEIPDIVGNLRVEQAWGSAQLSGALHEVSITDPYYGTGYYDGLSTSNTWGWAIGGTVEFKLPFIAAGDSLLLNAGYADGALRYLGLAGSPQKVAVGVGSIGLSQWGSTLIGDGAYYTVADAVRTDVWGNTSTVTGWNVSGQVRHFWTPALRSALYAGYVSVNTPDNVVAAYDFNLWQVGFNTIWSPVKNLDIGAEVLYSKVDGSVPLGSYASYTSGGTWGSSLVGGSTDVVSGGLRVQRNF